MRNELYTQRQIRRADKLIFSHFLVKITILRRYVDLPSCIAYLGLDAAAEVLAPGYSIDYAGESRQSRQEGNTLLGVLGVSLVFVFLAFTVQASALDRYNTV